MIPLGFKKLLELFKVGLSSFKKIALSTSMKAFENDEKWFLYHPKNALKAFNDFKNKQQKCMK